MLKELCYLTKKVGILGFDYSNFWTMFRRYHTAWHDLLKSGAPNILKVSEDARGSILSDGALNNKTKTLMTMLCDALLGHDSGVATIANRARAAGASEEEIAETVGVAFLMGGLPALVTGANAFKK